MVRSIVPIWNDNGDKVEAALIEDLYLSMSLSRRLFTISDAFGEYEQAKRTRGPVKTIYVLILLLVALLVIFIGFWFGLRIATDITEPIERLATGTESIAAGDLDVYIKPIAEPMSWESWSGLSTRWPRICETDGTSWSESIWTWTAGGKYMETVLRNVAAGVLAVDSDLAITAMNNSARRLLGISREEVTDWSLMAVLPEASATRRDRDSGRAAKFRSAILGTGRSPSPSRTNLFPSCASPTA